MIKKICSCGGKIVYQFHVLTGKVAKCCAECSYIFKLMDSDELQTELYILRKQDEMESDYVEQNP